MNYLVFGNFVLLALIKCVVSGTATEETLQLIIATFRHGDRTNDVATVYPKDPHANETYEPFGLGELTNNGKKREYELGQFLRKRYIKFLGPLYKKEELEAVSTDVIRTKESLQLVLAGLFPPNQTPLKWNKHLNWNPIAYSYLNFASNRILSIPIFFCPRFIKLYYDYKQTPGGQSIENDFNMWYKYISDNSGLNVTEVLNVFSLYFCLAAETEWGLQLPDWTKKVYPDYLKQAAIKNYELFMATPQLSQLNGGFLLKKIINDMVAKTNGSSASQKRKIYLYSAHEINVAALLGAMNLFFPHIPPYGAFVIIELHNFNGANFVKVFYQDYSSKNLREMSVPGCSFICPITTFINLLAKNIPNTENGDPCIT